MVRAAKGRQVNLTAQDAAKKRAGKGDDRVIRGFVTGLLWGGVVAGAGLAVMSQVAPLPQPEQAAAPAPAPNPIATPAPEPEPSPEPTPEPAAPAETPAPEPAPDLQPEILQKIPDPAPSEAAPSAPEAPSPEASSPAPQPEALPLAQPQGVEGAAPLAPLTPSLPDAAAAPSLPAAQDDIALAPADIPTPPQSDAAPAADAVPPPPPPGEKEEALLQPIAPAAEPLSDPTSPIQILPVDPATEPSADALAEASPEPAPEPIPEPAPEPAPQLTPAPQVLVPDAGGLQRDVPGVTTNRLPRIGDSDAPADSMAEGESPDALSDPLAEAEVIGTTPLELFARPFDNPDGLPLFAILLIDEGLDLEERQRLANLPFPITFAIDPLAPDAAEASRLYRAAGQEVAMIASGLPEGATPTDMEQTFQTLDLALPEAVVLLDRRTGGFQDSLDLARQAVPIVAQQGRGIVTYERGLNSADQVARREGVPRATIFRILDAEGESIPKMRNYLDRAAFKAAQEGRVVVIGMAVPETVAAILEWTVEGRASSVAIAPISAALLTETAN
jgi:hypothetical protein